MKPIKYRELVKKLKAGGFALERKASGSHEVWFNQLSSRSCSVPRHTEVASGTAKNIIKQMGLSEKEFRDL